MMRLPGYAPDADAQGIGGAPERTIALADILAGVRRQAWVVAVVFVTIVAVTMWYTLKLPRLYRATTTVRIQETTSPIAGAGPTVVRDFRVNPIQTEQQIIRSQSVAERVAEQLGLRLAIRSPDRLRHSALFGEIPPHVDSLPTVSEMTVRLGEDDYVVRVDEREVARAPYGMPVSHGGVTFTIPRRPDVADNTVRLEVLPLLAAIARVQEGIRTEGINETNIIQISYTGTDPALVKQIADEIATAYADFSSEAKRQQARSTTVFIQQSLAEQQQRLLAAQNALKEFKEREQLSNVAAEVGALSESIQSFQRDRDAALVERRVYLTLMGGLTQADTTTEELRRLANTNAIQNQPYISKLYDRWFELQRDREEFISRGHTDAFDDVKAIDSLIVQTKRELQVASALYLQALSSRLSSLDSTIGNLRRETEKYPSLEAAEARLTSHLRSVQSVYDQLQGEYQRARISETQDAGAVRVIDRAALPGSPVAPNRTRILIAAVLFGLLLGIAGALWLDSFDESIRSPEELRKIADWAILGTIPRISGDKMAMESKLATHLDPRSPVAESYRSLRTNLSYARANRALRVVVFTSPGPADGKSTTVANLAITFAQQGQRTLVIDADLRRAVLYKLFDVPRAPGVSDVLTGQRTLASAVSATNIPNLFVLGSGSFPPNPAELLGSQAMRDVLREAAETYDMVLIDTPPLLAVTDAAVLSTMAEGVVVVVRMGSTARPALRRAIAQLEAVESRLIGMVLNDVDVRRGGYYQGNYGYYYYYYHTETEGNGNNGGVLSRLPRWMRPAGRH